MERTRQPMDPSGIDAFEEADLVTAIQDLGYEVTPWRTATDSDFARGLA